MAESALESTRRKLQEQLKELELATEIETLISQTGLTLKPWIVSDRYVKDYPYMTFRIETLDDVKVILTCLKPKETLKPVILIVDKSSNTFEWLWEAPNGKIFTVKATIQSTWNGFARVSYRQPRKYVYDPKLVFNWEKFGFNEPQHEVCERWNSWGQSEYPPTYRVIWHDGEMPFPEFDE